MKTDRKLSCVYLYLHLPYAKSPWKSARGETKVYMSGLASSNGGAFLFFWYYLHDGIVGVFQAFH